MKRLQEIVNTFFVLNRPAKNNAEPLIFFGERLKRCQINAGWDFDQFFGPDSTVEERLFHIGREDKDKVRFFVLAQAFLDHSATVWHPFEPEFAILLTPHLALIFDMRVGSIYRR